MPPPPPPNGQGGGQPPPPPEELFTCGEGAAEDTAPCRTQGEDDKEAPMSVCELEKFTNETGGTTVFCNKC